MLKREKDCNKNQVRSPKKTPESLEQFVNISVWLFSDIKIINFEGSHFLCNGIRWPKEPVGEVVLTVAPKSKFKKKVWVV